MRSFDCAQDAIFPRFSVMPGEVVASARILISVANRRASYCLPIVVSGIMA
ncbi:MAG: hypothetical protein HN341_11165 [Verrucomicrobia bacterium]|nr:hypothetical protein [Verrucomicrobiota bacterium]